MTYLDTSAAIANLVRVRDSMRTSDALYWPVTHSIERLLKTLPDDVVDVTHCFDPLQIVSHLIGPRHKVVLETIRGKSYDQMVTVHDLYHRSGPYYSTHQAEDLD